MKETKVRLLEEFPAWKLSRELNQIVDKLYQNVDEKTYFIIKRGTLAVLSEKIMNELAVAFERTDSYLMITSVMNCIENIARMKTELYILYDMDKITEDNFVKILICLTKLRREMETLKKFTKNIVPFMQEELYENKHKRKKKKKININRKY
jgi:hypothetical protein